LKIGLEVPTASGKLIKNLTMGNNEKILFQFFLSVAVRFSTSFDVSFVDAMLLAQNPFKLLSYSTFGLLRVVLDGN